MTMILLFGPILVAGIAAFLAVRDSMSQEEELRNWSKNGYTLDMMVAVLEKARRRGEESVAAELRQYEEVLEGRRQEMNFPVHQASPDPGGLQNAATEFYKESKAGSTERR